MPVHPISGLSGPGRPVPQPVPLHGRWPRHRVLIRHPWAQAADSTWSVDLSDRRAA